MSIRRGELYDSNLYTLLITRDRNLSSNNELTAIILTFTELVILMHKFVHDSYFISCIPNSYKDCNGMFKHFRVLLAHIRAKK